MTDVPLVGRLADYVQAVLDPLLARIPQWIWSFLYWPAFGFVALLFVMSTGLFAIPGIVAPVALVLCARWWGLAGVPKLIYVAALLPMIYVAFFMNLYYGNVAEISTAGPLIGAIVFVVTAGGFADILRRADAHYRGTRHDTADPALAEHRLHLVRLTFATMAMFVLQNLALLLCLLALIRRRQWTATAAGIGCAGAALLSYSSGGPQVDWIALPIGLWAAREWIMAPLNPYWRPRYAPPTPYQYQ